MKTRSLMFLRMSLGLLLVLWGLDKLVNVEHSVRVAEAIYFGVGAEQLFLNALGVAEMMLGVIVMLGLWRRIAYPLLVLMNGATLLGVWRSIVDPWGWYLEGTNVLFFPSLIIFAGCLVVWAFMDEDTLSLDAKRAAADRPPPLPKPD